MTVDITLQFDQQEQEVESDQATKSNLLYIMKLSNNIEMMVMIE